MMVYKATAVVQHMYYLALGWRQVARIYVRFRLAKPPVGKEATALKMNCQHLKINSKT